MKVEQLDWNNRPWLYLVFNWGVPQFCAYGAAPCFEYVARMCAAWETPFPEGSLKVAAYRPGGEPGLDLQEIDLTDAAVKFILKRRSNG